MDSTTLLLKEITEVHGVAGYEKDVRELVHRKFDELHLQIQQDKIGSLVAVKPGEAENPRVMLAGHMDEIGFMVKQISKEGYIKFLPLGGWFDQVLLGSRVVIKTRKGDVTGVIGVKPPHMLSQEERNKVVAKKDMYIDIGATCQEEVEQAGVAVGDPIVPKAAFEVLANGKTLLSKAFDDRVGVAIMIDVARNLAAEKHPNTVYCAATVMEEIGLRGAATSVEIVNPDVAIVLEADIAGDVPGVTPDESTVKLGKGPTIVLYDARMIPNLALRNLVMDTAKELDIPLQTSTIEGGATDGGMIHLHKTGVPTVVLGVASRHIHSQSCIMHRDDYDYAVRLVTALVKKLDQATVKSLTQ